MLINKERTEKESYRSCIPAQVKKRRRISFNTAGRCFAKAELYRPSCRCVCCAVDSLSLPLLCLPFFSFSFFFSNLYLPTFIFFLSWMLLPSECFSVLLPPCAVSLAHISMAPRITEPLSLLPGTTGLSPYQSLRNYLLARPDARRLTEGSRDAGCIQYVVHPNLSLSSFVLQFFVCLGRICSAARVLPTSDLQHHHHTYKQGAFGLIPHNLETSNGPFHATHTTRLDDHPCARHCPSFLFVSFDFHFTLFLIVSRNMSLL